MLILNACTNVSVLGTVLFFKKLVQIISIIVPILLVLLITIDFAKAVIANSDDDMKRAQSLAIKRIIAGLLVFFVPLIVDTAFTTLSDKGVSGLSCYNNATASILNPLIEADKANLQLKEEERQQLIEAAKQSSQTAKQMLADLKSQNRNSSSNSNINNGVKGYYSTIATTTKYRKAKGLVEATSGEHGSLNHNKAGDQSGNEVKKSSYRYGGWVLLARAKDPTKAEIIAKCMEDCANNSHIGYDQSSRASLYDEAKKKNWNIPSITKNVETTCSSVASVCINAAGIKFPRIVYADANPTMKSSLKKRKNDFVIITDTSKMKSTKYVKRGDILCANHHTAVAR